MNIETRKDYNKAWKLVDRLMRLADSGVFSGEDEAFIDEERNNLYEDISNYNMKRAGVWGHAGY